MRQTTRWGTRDRGRMPGAAGLAVVLVVLATGLASGDGADTRPSGAHADSDDTRGPLDLAVGSLDQDLRQARVGMRLYERFPPLRELSTHPKRISGAGRHLCVVVDGASTRHRVLCPGGPTERGRIEVGVSRLFRSGALQPRGSFAAELERTSSRSIRLRFPLAAAGLDPGGYSWRVVSGWNGVKCAAPQARRRTHTRCADRVPNSGGFALVVRELAKVGCHRPGDNLFTNGPRNRKRVALTFDDGPSDYTAAILRVFEKHGGRATFFELGSQIPGRESLLRRALADGHEIGNHSMQHEQYPSQASMHKANRLVEEATGFRPCLYRPVYGAVSSGVLAAAKAEGMSSVLWDVDTRDWELPGSGAIVQRASAATKGSIVLMHSGGGPRQQTVDALPHIIDNLRGRGFRLVTVTKLMGGRYRYREAG